MFKYILFDLDGTLTDSGLGITKAAQYALKEFGIDEPDISRLGFFVGPPLDRSFMDFYHMDHDTMLKAVKKFREYYGVTGIYENELYPGIDDMLSAVKSQGVILAVASSKPQVHVHTVLEHFNIKQYFDVIVGAELDGTRTDKKEVLAEVFKQLSEMSGNEDFNKTNTAMVGDRFYDVVGAKEHNVYSIAVKYGYYQGNELEEAGADTIVDTVADLKTFLLK